MKAGERGFLLLSSNLGNSERKPLTTAQLRVLADRAWQMELPASERELEVLRLVVAGETDATIAAKLFISVATVKTHVQNMKHRAGFRNRTELAVRARESGLVIFDQEPTE